MEGLSELQYKLWYGILVWFPVLQMNQKLEMHGGVKWEWKFDLMPELLPVMPWWDIMKLLAYGEQF